MNNQPRIHRQLFQSFNLDSTENSCITVSPKRQTANNRQRPIKINKMGRPTKNLSMNNSDSIENGYMRIEFMREQQRRKCKPNTKNIYTFFPTYTTLIDKPLDLDYLFNNTMGFANHEEVKRKRGFSLPRQQTPFEQKNYSDRRRLIPLKKHAPIEKKIYRPKQNVTFLSVEKVSLIPISKQSTVQKNSLIDKNVNAISKTHSFDDNTTKIEASLLDKIIPLREPLSAQPRFKPFISPFQRYYYYDFLWKISISNGILPQFSEFLPKKYKVYIGSGNNSMLIKTYFKRRQYWWSITQKIQDANFVWTQIKTNQVHSSQKRCLLEQYPCKIKKSEYTIKKTQLVRRNGKILNQVDLEMWNEYYLKHRENQEKMNPSFMKRNKYFKKKQLTAFGQQNIKIHNHLPRNYILGNKKALFSTMKAYYEASKENVFQFIPLTFHIQNGIEDPQYLKFLNYYYQKNKQVKNSEKQEFQGKKVRNIWIVKPGQFSNRGNGIIVCKTLDEVKTIVKQKKKHQNGNWKTYIVQQYIDRPMLYCKRKFDIRHYMLITCINGHIKGYWYELGYIRTTSYQYTLKNSFGSIHLTNDAIQKQLPDYGKYEKGNKLSYDDFQKYLHRQFKGKHSFYKKIYPLMKKIAKDSMRASSLLLHDDRKGHNFQVFGFDFMIDANFHPWLIEINTNPCLQISCPVLMDVIPLMIQNTLKIGVDSLIAPPYSFAEKRPRFNQNTLEQNKFQLLYDSIQEQQDLKKLFEGKGGVDLNFTQLQRNQDQYFDDDGVELDD